MWYRNSSYSVWSEYIIEFNLYDNSNPMVVNKNNLISKVKSNALFAFKIPNPEHLFNLLQTSQSSMCH